jgi:hypothetical protein
MHPSSLKARSVSRGGAALAGIAATALFAASRSAKSSEHTEAYSLQNAFTSSFKLLDAVVGR